MSLLDKIENLQKRPEGYRRKVLVLTITIIMILIVIAWVLTMDLF